MNWKVLALLLCLVTAKRKECSDFEIEIKEDQLGEDTRIKFSEFNMLWFWLSLSVVFFFGSLISVIRDTVPRPIRGDIHNRYPSGESKEIIRYFLEEYLITGWLVPKERYMRFSNTARWALIFTIVYSELLVTGIFYERDSRDLDNMKDFEEEDLVYSVLSCLIGFVFYLVGYFLLVNTFEVKGSFQRYKHCFGYLFVGLNITSSAVLVFVYVYRVLAEEDKDYSGLVGLWVECFSLTLLFEVLVSENVRLIARTLILWSRKTDTADNSVVEMTSKMERRPLSFADQDA